MAWPPILGLPDGSSRPLRQGDLVPVRLLPYLVSPQFPLLPDQAETSLVDDGRAVKTMEVITPGEYMAIISDDCDVLRDYDTDDDRYLNLAPLRPAERAEWEFCVDGAKSTLSFSYPPVDGQSCVLDVRTITTITKPALLSPDCQPRLSPLSEAQHGRLQQWLGRRFGRPGWSADVDKQLVRPIQRAVAAQANNRGVAPVWSAVLFVGLAYTPGAEAAALLVVVDAVRAGLHPDRLVEAQTQLRRDLSGRFREARPTFGVNVTVRDATQVTVAEFLAYRRLDPELSVG